jgi:hypothetical protein
MPQHLAILMPCIVRSVGFTHDRYARASKLPIVPFPTNMADAILTPVGRDVTDWYSFTTYSNHGALCRQQTAPHFTGSIQSPQRTRSISKSPRFGEVVSKTSGYCWRIVQHDPEPLIVRGRPRRKYQGFVNSPTVSQRLMRAWRKRLQRRQNVGQSLSSCHLKKHNLINSL